MIDRILISPQFYHYTIITIRQCNHSGKPVLHSHVQTRTAFNVSWRRRGKGGCQSFFRPFRIRAIITQRKPLKLRFSNIVSQCQLSRYLPPKSSEYWPQDKTNPRAYSRHFSQKIKHCEGHGGTHGVKKETLEFANKNVNPITRQIEQHNPDYYGSDRPVAGRQTYREQSRYQLGYCAPYRPTFHCLQYFIITNWRWWYENNISPTA